MLVSKNAKICITPNANFKICVTPNAKPQCKSVEYRLHWVRNANFVCWSCTFHCVRCQFHSRWVPFFQWNTVNVEIFARYIFSRISPRAIDARKFNVSENYYHNRTNRINWHVREN